MSISFPVPSIFPPYLFFPFSYWLLIFYTPLYKLLIAPYQLNISHIPQAPCTTSQETHIFRLCFSSTILVPWTPGKCKLLRIMWMKKPWTVKKETRLMGEWRVVSEGEGRKQQNTGEYSMSRRSLRSLCFHSSVHSKIKFLQWNTKLPQSLMISWKSHWEGV